MDNRDITIYATVERGPGGMYVNILPDSIIPTYTNSLIKAVRKQIDLDKLLVEENMNDKLEIGKIKINSDTNKLNSSDIIITDINNNIEEKYAIPT